MALRDPIEELTQRAGRLNIGEDGQLRYFGAQSNYHLLHGPIYNETNQPVQNFQTIGLATAGLLGTAVEASKDLQDHLLELYWRWQNPWLYMIHKASFMQDYNNGGMGTFCSPLLLSAIFALASRYSDRVEVRSDPADPHSAGNKFAEQAKILLLYECEAPTTTTVQAASLLSLRWMSENKESLGWLYIGMGTRMAYNLGLNLDCSEWVTSGMITEQEAQVRRITWWGCYKLDKSVLPFQLE
ncbi:fungal-specific transcription factor domain-containing protein [Aspergillus varians]